MSHRYKNDSTFYQKNNLSKNIILKYDAQKKG